MDDKCHAADILATESLKSTGKTGVELRWHKNAEFKALSENQRDELKAWCATCQDNKHSSKKQKGNGEKSLTPGSNKYKKMINRQVAAMVASKTATTTNSNKKGGEIDVEGIISAIKGMTAASGNADVSSAAAAASAPKKSVAGIAEVQLHSILQNSKLH